MSEVDKKINDVRRCKYCRYQIITRYCFLKEHGYSHANEELWDNKGSQILCNKCAKRLQDYLNDRIGIFDKEGFTRYILDNPKRSSIAMRNQFWFLLDLGIDPFLEMV